MKWMAWSINSDNGGGGGTAVWDKCRGLWDAAGIQNFPWMHVRTMEDLNRLLQVGQGKNSPAIGLNIEDVVGDKLKLSDVAARLEVWPGEVHMASLCWLQNEQGWGALKRCVVALEIFIDEVPICANIQDCIDHAFAEGLTQVTLMLKTKPPNTPAIYGNFFSICHSLYTADDITPTAEAWNAWGFNGNCIVPTPPAPPIPPVTKPPLTPKEVPYTGPYSLASGSHRSRGPTAKALKIAMKRMGEVPFAGKDNSSFDEHYNQALEDALDRTTNASWDGYGEKRWEKVRGLIVPPGRSASGEYALNKEARDLILKDYAQMNQPVVPNLGPLWSGGKAVLDQSPTHSTSGIPLYPAFDDAFKAGTIIIAPEDIEVTRDSSSNPGDACYAAGASKIDYWFGHLVKAPAKGTKIKHGQQIGVVLDHSVGGGPHVHCGVNIERLFGSGQQLEWGANGNGPDYTYGSPSIRRQLEARMV